MGPNFLKIWSELTDTRYPQKYQEIIFNCFQKLEKLFVLKNSFINRLKLPTYLDLCTFRGRCVFLEGQTKQSHFFPQVSADTFRNSSFFSRSIGRYCSAKKSIEACFSAQKKDFEKIFFADRLISPRCADLTYV